jgi:hypothetical protein
MTYGVCILAGHDPVEGFIACGHLAEVEVHLSERLCEDDVQAAPPVTTRLPEARPAYIWKLSRTQEYPHGPTHVFLAHFVLTDAHLGRSSQSVIHRSNDAVPGMGFRSSTL